MSKAFLGAFIAVAAIAVGGVDYNNQARRAGSAPGAFSASDYLATISGRFSSHQAALAETKERNALLALDRRDFLPEAPEGWTRRDWDDSAADRLGRRYDMARDDFVPDEIKEDPTLKALNALGKAAAAEADATEVYVYEKPDGLVALRVQLVQPAGGGIPGMAMQMVANNIEAMSGKDGFAIVQGVTYRRETGLFGAGEAERDWLVVTGQIGDRIRISARAQAADADIIGLLDGIDYDGLNRMLETPVAGIGGDAPEIAPEDRKAEADRRVAEAARLQRIEAERAELNMRLAALELTHRSGGIDAGEYEDAKAKLEARRESLDGQAAGAIEAVDETRMVPAAEMPAGADVGGIFAMIKGVLGGAETTADAPVAEAEPQEVRINRGSGGNCTVTAGIKRCTVGK